MSTAPPFAAGDTQTAQAARASGRPSSAPPYASNRPTTVPPYAVMADGRARRVSAPPSGTAVERTGAPPRTFLLVGGVAAGVGVLLAVLLTRGGNEAKATPTPRPSQAAVETATPVIVETPVVTAAVPTTPVKVAAMSQAAAVEQLRRAFGKARLYSQISISGDQLELRSSACEDQQLGNLLEQSRTQLAESGLHRVRCLQPHGQVVFTREL